MILFQFYILQRIILTRCISIILSFVIPALVFAQSAESSNWEWTSISMRMKLLATKFFLLDESETPNSLLISVMLLIYLYRTIVLIYIELFFVLTTLFFLHLSHDFISVLDSDFIAVRFRQFVNILWYAL